MEFVEKADDRPEPISIARCRELLGEDAESMTDQEVASIRRHAETMACVVIEMYREQCRALSSNSASQTQLARLGEWIYAADHGRRGDLRSRQHQPSLEARSSRASFGWQAKEQTENLSVPTRLRACEEYCRRQSYEVLERFHEEGESAKSTDRSQLQNLLTFCRLNKGRVHFGVVFNLTRFARDTPSPKLRPQASTTTSRCARTCSHSASRCGRQRSQSTTPPLAS